MPNGRTITNQERRARARDLENVCTNCGAESYMTLGEAKKYTRIGPHRATIFIKICAKCNQPAKECKCI